MSGQDDFSTLAKRFDPLVERAMAKWPKVPECFGWLRLDRRGQWLIDNSLVQNKQIVTFINRNYAADEQGRWFFQNGPQRVFAKLDYTPWILQINAEDELTTHTTQAVTAVSAALIDDEGNVLLESNCGIGVVDDRDLTRFADRFLNEDGTLLEHQDKQIKLKSIARADVASKFQFDPAPQAPELPAK